MENGKREDDEPMRLPTVAEAIPFSPFSSIVPFNPDLIPPFLALPHPPTTAYEDQPEIRSIRRELEQLSVQAKKTDEANRRYQSTMRDVQKLLNADNLTQIKFKCSKKIIPTAKADNTTANGKPPALSQFAKSIYESIDPTFVRIDAPNVRPPKPKPRPQVNGQAEKSKARSEKVKVEPQKEEIKEDKTSTPSRTPQAVVQLKAVTAAQLSEYEQVLHSEPPQQPLPVLIEPTATDPTSMKVEPEPVKIETTTQGSELKTPQLFVVPKALSPAQRQEYQFIPADSTPIAPPKPRPPKVNPDHQRQANAAVEELQTQLQNIFEAEDYMQPDTSGETSMQSNNVFVTCDVQDGAVPMLVSRVQDSLDSAIMAVVKFDRLGDIEVDSLVRVQRLCESAVSAIPSISLRISDDWSEQDITEWLGRIATVKNGLVAARTMMRIMTGGSRYKEIQSEDNVKAVLYTLRWVIDSCIIPVVGERPALGERIKGERDAPSNQAFVIASDHRAELLGLVKAIQRCLRLVGDLFVKTNIDETSISSAELMCRTLIFGDNAPFERDSALGISSFETLRRACMDLIAKIFTKYIGQRQYIIDQILQSLEKLPPTKQNARQFTLIDAKPIQLVSALLMRLVQTSATAGDDLKIDDDDDSDSEDEDASGESDAEGDYSSNEGKPQRKQKKKSKSRNDLASIAKPLYNAAQSNATEIVRTLLHRALSTSKSSDEPFRKLLDIFTEDFINVLGSSDWPSAEILLRSLVAQMLVIVENPKSPAPSRSLGLELLGTIGSAVLDTRASTQDYARSLDAPDPISKRLSALASSISNGSLNMPGLVSFNGPYRVVIEYLHNRGDKDAQLQTARGYHLIQWAELVNGKMMAAEEAVLPELKRKILRTIHDPYWLEEEQGYENITTVQGKLAAKLVTSHLMLCRAFPRILGVLLKSMSSEQSTIRSRALKSVTSLLEKSPALLESEHHILDTIIRSTRDKSSLVRDSAILLIEKCVSLQPALAPRVNGRVIERTTDASALIRKRAIKFLKQLYLMIKDSDTRATIANAVIVRVADSEESVAEVALATIEEIWFSGFGEESTGVDASIQLRSQVALIVKTVEPSDAVASVLEGLVRRMSTKAKSGSDNQKACKAFVSVLFDGVIDSSDIPGSPAQWSILRTLTIFAKAAPKLFKASQLERLEPYAKDLSTQDDLRVFQHVITIFRYTFPHITTISHEVLGNLQQSLLNSLNRIPSSELATIAPCIAAIAKVTDSLARVAQVVRSALMKATEQLKADMKANPVEARKTVKLLAIVGQFTKACDFEPWLEQYKRAVPGFSGNSVSGYIVMLSCRFTSPKYPTEVRAAAIDAVCAVCSTHPQHFLREDVVSAFKVVFADRIQELEQVLLTSIADFFASQETPEEDPTAHKLGSGIESGTERLGNTYQATNLDSAFGVLAQTFLEDFLRIALASQDDVAMAAARIVVSINRQGRATPRQSGYCLVALETCPNPAIAKMAFLEHKAQYTKHEGTFESDLPRSLEKTFKYQRNITTDVSGYSGQPPVSKLYFLWEVLKLGKAKVRNKLFTSTCSKIAFDPNTFKPTSPTPERLFSARFNVEAMAFLEFDRVDELLHLLSCLEKAFSTTGTPVAQAIEMEVQQLNVPDDLPKSETTIEGGDDLKLEDVEASEVKPAKPTIDPKRLLQLAVHSQILSLLFETHSFLRRAWNMYKYTSKVAKKPSAKDGATKLTRAATYATLAEAYQNKVNEIMKVAEGEMEQRAICNAFAETFKRDDEVKVGTDEEEEGDAAADDMDDARSEASEMSRGSAPLGTPRKRKRTGSANAGPKKRSKQTPDSGDDDDDADGGWD